MTLSSRLSRSRSSKANKRKNRAKRRRDNDTGGSSNAPSRRLKRSGKGGILPGFKSPKRTERAEKLAGSKNKSSNEPTTRNRSGALVERPPGLNRPPIKANNKEKADDGTKLWDGQTQPDFDKGFEEKLIKKQPRKFDITKLRWAYRTEVAPGVFEYVPLKDDAEDFEIERGIYATVDLKQDLNSLVQNKAKLRRYRADGEQIEAYEYQEILNLIQDPNNLIVRTPRSKDL